jgi:hypothetical protein
MSKRMLTAFVMEASYCRDKAAMCLRLAQGLSQNNPARFELVKLAEDFGRRARGLEQAERRPSQDDSVE